MPYLANFEPIGPIENGTMYISRPRMQLGKRSSAFMDKSSGAIHLPRIPLSGGVACGMVMYLSGVHTNVFVSTRATSFGSVRQTKLFL